MVNPEGRQARIRTLRYEADGVLSMELIPLAGDRFDRFTPGAHLDIHLRNGLTRCYSLINDPDEMDRYVLGVLKDPGSRGGSIFIHENFRCGQIIEIGAPRNHFPLDEHAPASLLIAGGIGVTPILSMFRRLRSLGREVRLVYCARSRERAAFLQDLDALGGDIELHFDDEKEGRPLDIDAVLSRQADGVHVYCCGPSAMVSAVEAACGTNGITNIHVERFSASPAISVTLRSEFTVELVRSRKTIRVRADQSILGAVLDAGVDCEFSCMQGICGACETKVLEGRPDHLDSALDASEKHAGQQMMICVSRSRDERLALDL